MRYVLPGILSLITICLIVISIENNQPVSIHCFSSSSEATLGLGLVSFLAIGVITGLSFITIVSRGEKTSGKQIATWDAQDAKLQSQVKSDREKQLEAKIDTLEAALKSALNKNK